MHCPSCGTDTTLDQRFCRSCGMDLETISKLVAEHSSPEALKLEKTLSEKHNQQRMYQGIKWGLISLILGMAMLVLVKTLALDKTFNLVGSLFLFLSMGLLTWGVLSTMRDPASLPGKLPGKRSRTGLTAKLSEAEPTKELPPTRIPVPLASITERTTQLIATEDVSKSRE